jgi:hypothetical protein
MNQTDAASRLRAIAVEKSHARQQYVYPRTTGSIERVLANSTPRPQGPYNRETRENDGDTAYLPFLSTLAWVIWAFLNVFFVAFVFFMQERAPPPASKPVMPLLNIEKVELLQFAMKINGQPLPNWKEADVTKGELIDKLLRLQYPLSEEAHKFTTSFRTPSNYQEYEAARATCSQTNWTKRELGQDDFFTYKYYPSTPLWERSMPEGRNSYCQALPPPAPRFVLSSPTGPPKSLNITFPFPLA